MFLPKYLLVGEPDGGGTTADPPAPDPEPGTPPEPEPPAPDEGAPADGDGEPPADGDGAPEPEDFTPEERRALLERLKDSDEFKELVPKVEQPKPEKPTHPLIARQDDPLYRAIAQEVSQSYERIDALAKKLADPNAEIKQSDADAIAADLSMAGHFQALAERRGQLTTITMIAMRELGVEGDFDDKNPIHGELEQAIADIEQKMTHNYRQRGRLLKEADPNKRQQMAQAIEESDAGLVGGFLNNVIKLAGKAGEAKGLAAAEKDFEKRTSKAVTLAKQNGNVEATAKARKVLAGAVVQQSAITPSKAESDNSDDARKQRLAFGTPTDDDRAWLQKQHPG